MLGRGTYQDHISWLIGQPGGDNINVLHINEYFMGPRMVIYATIEVIRPVHGWEEDKYIGTSPYWPSDPLWEKYVVNLKQERMNLKFYHLNSPWIRSWVRYSD